jgi:sirohydrochlorin ferrochelatase
VKRAILLVDHGSRLPEANAQLDDLANAIRGRVSECIVGVAHLEIAEPDIAQGIANCVAEGAEEIIVHPYFLSPGRHTTQDIPAQVALAAQQYPGIQIQISEPLGGHAALLDIVLDRVSDADR